MMLRHPSDDEGPEPREKTMQQHTNAEFTVHVADDWQTVSTLRPPPSAGIGDTPTVTIEWVPMAPLQTLAAHADAVLIELARSTEFDLLWRTDVVIDGRAGIEFRCSFQRDVTRIEQRIVMVAAHDGSAIHVTGEARTGRGAAMESAVQHVLASARIAHDRRASSRP